MLVVVVVVKIELKWCEIMCVIVTTYHFQRVVTPKQHNTWWDMFP
jgi:hypothetical protein